MRGSFSLPLLGLIHYSISAIYETTVTRQKSVTKVIQVKPFSDV